MPTPPRLVTVFGGSGFIGRYIAQRLAAAGCRVRVAVRRPDEAYFVRPYGKVGQVEPVQANIRDDASTASVMTGAAAVVNCVGILAESGKQRFEPVMAEGAGRIARLAASAGVQRLVHISAIGADPDSDSAYGRAKAAGEARIREAFPEAVILRPSIVFGTEDAFFNRFAAMARLLPVLPVVGPNTRFQPVYVGDVATAAANGATLGAPPGLYELGGPEVATFRELMARMLRIIRRRRPIVAIPFGLADLQARILDGAQRLSGGLFANTVLTRDQVRQLRRDNVVAPDAKGLAELGIAPTGMEAVLESYLYAYRPAGQFTAIQESAARLRT